MSINATVVERLLMTMITESFPDCIKSPHGGVITALLTKEDLTW